MAIAAQLQAEKDDWEAKNYEEILNVEERFLNRIIVSKRNRLLKEHGVAIFTRGRATAPAPSLNATSGSPATEAVENGIGATDEATDNTTTNGTDNGKYAGFRLLSKAFVPLVLQGYKEKVQLARNELESLLKEFESLQCIDLFIPPEVSSYFLACISKN